ncbi:MULTISPECIES: hypothetical protein [unclassified Microcoleus]|uniref:hypothetical protein n=1 Tax=unclassified Microcoleus TaxID=2642155 RepID=UPI002FD1D7A2
MNKFEYWFLDTAVTEVVGFSWIVPDDRYGDLAINRAPLNLTVAEITDLLHCLFQTGDLLATTPSDFDEYGFNRGFIPSKSEIESAIHQRINLFYFLTSQGGEKWECVSHPNWNLYMTGCDGFLGCADRKLLEAYLALYHLIDHGNTRAYIIPGTESWKILTPWQATYWKTLPIGYEVRYESRSVEFDESAKRDPKLIEREKKANNWYSSTRIWYTNYFKQCEAELNYSTALAKSPNLKIEYLMLKSAICGCESLINFAHSEQLSQAEVVLAADSLFQRGDIKAMVFTDEYDTEPASDVVLTRAGIQDHLIGRLVASYYLTPQGGARWEAMAHPDWNKFFIVNFREFFPDEDEIFGTQREILEQLLSLDRLILGKQHIPGTEKWNVLEPWEATYWKTLPQGYHVSCEFQHNDSCLDYQKEGALPELVEEHEQALQWYENMKKWYTDPKFD